MKKILHITLRSDIGGGPKHVYDLARTIRKSYSNQFVQFIAAPNELPFAPKFKEIVGANFFEMPHRKFTFTTLLQLKNYIQKNNIDIIHSHGRGAGFYSRILKLMLGKNIRVIHTFHGVHAYGMKALIKLIFELPLRFFCDRYICVSKDEMLEVKKWFLASDKKISVVNNGIEFDESSWTEPKPLIINQMNKIRLGTLARLDYQKGIDLLLNKVDQYIEKDPRLEFFIAGDGPQKSELDHLWKNLKYKNQVHFLGRMDIKDFFPMIDIYFSTSRWEGFPLSPLEAMVSGKPLMLSNVRGHGYFFENNLCVEFNGRVENLKYYSKPDLIKLSLNEQVKKTVDIYSL